ncbi:MAG: hypothetical protein PHU12_00640 [Candidatus Aenigmarchaeota archaeon]|nr:hypothetical protein [Candidatus Aenigmarchaeota archaeon]
MVDAIIDIEQIKLILSILGGIAGIWALINIIGLFFKPKLSIDAPDAIEFKNGDVKKLHFKIKNDSTFKTAKNIYVEIYFPGHFNIFQSSSNLPMNSNVDFNNIKSHIMNLTPGSHYEFIINVQCDSLMGEKNISITCSCENGNETYNRKILVEKMEKTKP